MNIREGLNLKIEEGNWKEYTYRYLEDRNNTKNKRGNSDKREEANEKMRRWNRDRLWIGE